jgi:hypothetical protein
MPSSERLTVSTCRHAHRRSEPAVRHVHRARRAGSPSRRSRIPCLFRPCVTPKFPRQSTALLRLSNRHDMRRLHHRVSVRNRVAGRLGNQARRRSGSVMIRRRSTCLTAMSTRVWPSGPVANETRRMKCNSPNFNEHEGEFDMRGAAEATAAARVRRARSRGGPAAPASPLPRPPPGGGRDGSSGNKGRSTCQSSDQKEQRLTAAA